MGAMLGLAYRLATEADLPAIGVLMERAIAALQSSYLSPAEIMASRMSMGMDTQLIADRTYFVVEHEGRLVGGGGWSFRSTLYSGDHSADQRDSRTLDPAEDAARIRAMYTDPDYVRRGVGRLVLALCEDAARAAGFTRIELMATLAGEPLYRASGYGEIELVANEAGATPVPLVRMGKALG